MSKPDSLSRTIARERLNAAGMTIRYAADMREYRVNYRGGSEDSAYYTTDLLDALHTGLHMALKRFGGPAENET